MSSELSDVLRDMAEGRRDSSEADDDGNAPLESAQPAAGTDDRSGASADSHDLAALEQQVADESGAPVGAVTPARQSSGGMRRDRGHRGLQAAAVPVLCTVGLLLILLGVWGTAVVNEHQIILSDRPDADRMARAMIFVGYPLGGALLAGAGYFIYNLRRH